MNLDILKSLLKRNKKYNGEVILSRHEYKKFGLTEWGMRKELRELRRNGLILTNKRYCGEKRFTNIYKISEKLMNIIKELLKDIKEGFDIVKFNTETKLEEVKNLLGLKGFGINFVISKNNDYKYTFNSENNIIARWSKKSKSDYKHFNLFNGLKEIFGLNTYDLIKEIG